MIDRRNCLHNKLFVVQNKRGRCFMYCSECMQTIRQITKKELKEFIKQEAKNGTY